MLPFTPTQFFDVFEAYNLSIWPAQVAAYGLAALAVLAIVMRARPAPALAFALLSVLWAWTGIVYHGRFFAEINPAAVAFAALFAAQAVLFAFPALSPRRPMRPDAWLGWALIFYAALVYPILNAVFGHVYPRTPSFAVTPCPLVIFTFGVMALSATQLPWRVFAAPVLWAFIGGTAAFLLGVSADLALPVAAFAGIVANARKPKLPAQPPTIPTKPWS